MFPINFNFPYRKKDGSLITMEKALDGAGADLDLVDLDDVAIESPTTGDALQYNGTSKKWENKAIELDVDDLDDVDITTPADGDILVYDGTAEKWINSGTLTDNHAYRYTTTDADENVTFLECNVLQRGKVVYITGSWQGDNTNAESILTLPSALRPSSVVRGTGGAHVPTNPTITTQFGVYNLATDGKITQASDTRKASQGNFVFIYTI